MIFWTLVFPFGNLRLESMKQTILLEERVFKKATKPAKKIRDVVKKACGFIPSNDSPEDYVLCIDEWKQYLTPDVKYEIIHAVVVLRNSSKIISFFINSAVVPNFKMGSN